MESLIPIINRLQDVFNAIGSDCIDLPQIVVVGTQSSGKSSVLENIVGRSFLPRGTGIVTRTPLMLQLVHTPKGSGPQRRKSKGTPDVEEFGIFSHSTKTFTDFEEIRSEIEAQTERITGNNKGISTEVITLKLHSPTVLNLTLVDLPGLTKVPVGDQPPDIETQIRNLVLKYIKNPNSIIMAVVTANTDMATNESLKLAKECDPKGERTLAVVTKLDLMDAGTDATDILSGRVIPVKLGIIGVINRSQKDINDKKSITQAQKDEATFLLKKYPSLADSSGTAYLAKTLNHLLMKHIKDCLPEVRDRVLSMITKHEERIKFYGKDIKDKNEALLQIITHFSSSYGDSITGASANLKSETIQGGAKLCQIFHSTFKDEVKKIDPLVRLTRKAILTLMHNATGPRPAIFIPELAFEKLVKDQVQRLEKPSLQCAQLVHEEMKQMLSRCCVEMAPLLERFPALRTKILDLVSELLTKRMVKVNSNIQNLIAMELAYINTRHPHFDRDGALLTKVETEDQLQEATTSFQDIRKDVYLRLPKDNLKQYEKLLMTDSEEKDCIVLEKLLASYFEAVRTNVLDTVPKAVMLHLVNFVKDKVQSELITKLYRSANTDNLFQEAKHIAQKREDNSNMLKALYEASNIISEITDFYV